MYRSDWAGEETVLALKETKSFDEQTQVRKHYTYVLSDPQSPTMFINIMRPVKCMRISEFGESQTTSPTVPMYKIVRSCFLYPTPACRSP